MAATILNSPRAVEMTIYIVRAFVQLRDLLASNRQLAAKFAELERKVGSHDQIIVGILKAIRELMHPPVPKTRPIGLPLTSMSKDGRKRGQIYLSRGKPHARHATGRSDGKMVIDLDRK